MREKTNKPSADVVIVATNPETIDGLEGYLRAAHVTARCTTDLDRCVGLVGKATLAFVIFPDDFGRERVLSVVADLQQRCRSVVPILITANATRFADLLPKSVVVMARPVWGWSILDAIRATDRPLLREEVRRGGG